MKLMNKRDGYIDKKNKNVEGLVRQIQTTLSRLQDLHIVDYYNEISIDDFLSENGRRLCRLSWNNHKPGRTSGDSFLQLEQYFNILEDTSYLALLADYSIVRCSFTFDKNKLVNESLLWWPSPIQIEDREYVEFFGISEVAKAMIQDSASLARIRMRSPIRIDFDSERDDMCHPRAHMHIESEDTRINTNTPICFNRFMQFILQNFYPQFKVSFSKSEFISFTYDQKRDLEYLNKTQLLYE